jgi:hypothetical protein
LQLQRQTDSDPRLTRCHIPLIVIRSNSDVISLAGPLPIAHLPIYHYSRTLRRCRSCPYNFKPENHTIPHPKPRPLPPNPPRPARPICFTFFSFLLPHRAPWTFFQAPPRPHPASQPAGPKLPPLPLLLLFVQDLKLFVTIFLVHHNTALFTCFLNQLLRLLRRIHAIICHSMILTSIHYSIASTSVEV